MGNTTTVSLKTGKTNTATVKTGYVNIGDILGDYTWTTTNATSKRNIMYSGYLENKDVYIKKVIYNNPATIVFWSDNTKTVAKCRENDIYSKECGLAICTLKKALSGTQVLRLFDDWVSESDSVTLKDVRKMYYD